MRSTSLARGLDPGIDRVSTGLAVRQHLGGELTRGVAELIARAVQRQPVEIIGGLDVACRIGDAFETEIADHGQERSRHVRHVALGAIGYQHDIRCDVAARADWRFAARASPGTPDSGQLLRTAPPVHSLHLRPVPRRAPRDTSSMPPLIMLDDRREPLIEIRHCG